MQRSFYKTFFQTTYPEAHRFLINHSWNPIFFPQSIHLSKQAYAQMQTVIQALFKLKKNYLPKPNPSLPQSALKKHQQDSVLMAYDFHVTQDIPKLIEINTNASGFLIANALYQFQKLPYKKAQQDLGSSFNSEWLKYQNQKNNKKQSFQEDDTKQNFQNINLNINKLNNPKKVVLIDDDILNQNMAIEFFMYKDFFKSIGWSCDILESSSLKIDTSQQCLKTPKGDKIDFIYNRSTDFYFTKHAHLNTAFLKEYCAISPHPREYYLLSDKLRLCEWSIKQDSLLELQNIKQNLLFSKILTANNQEQIWKHRKKYFFKHVQGYGGKLAYRGSSISYKKFQELCNLQILVQEFIAPSEYKDPQGVKWKVDFRAYVYEDRIQQIIARCYQGQLTNFKTEGSGFATVIID